MFFQNGDQQFVCYNTVNTQYDKTYKGEDSQLFVVILLLLIISGFVGNISIIVYVDEVTYQVQP